MRKDHLLAYMDDDRHARYTLFFIVEEDFRLWPEDEAMSPASVAATAWREVSKFLANSSTGSAGAMAAPLAPCGWRGASVRQR